MRPKFTRAQVQTMRELYTNKRATIEELVTSYSDDRKDQGQTPVTRKLIERVLFGVGDKAYEALEDYFEKQAVLCTRCGTRVHPSDAVYMDHSDKFSETTYHCQPCAAICRKPKRKRPSTAKPSPFPTRRRDYIKLHVDEGMKALKRNNPTFRASTLAISAVNMGEAAKRMWKKFYRDLRMRTIDEIRADILAALAPREAAPAAPVVAKTRVVYRKTDDGLVRVRAFVKPWNGSVSSMAKAYLEEFAEEKPDPAELVFVRRVKVDGEWMDDTSEPISFEEEEKQVVKIQRVKAVEAMKTPAGRWILVLPAARDHAWTGTRWAHHQRGISREAQISSWDNELDALTFAREFLLEKAEEEPRA